MGHHLVGVNCGWLQTWNWITTCPDAAAAAAAAACRLISHIFLLTSGCVWKWSIPPISSNYNQLWQYIYIYTIYIYIQYIYIYTIYIYTIYVKGTYAGTNSKDEP